MTATYDLVLTGGRVIDERNGIDGINDVAIKGGKIAAVGPELAASAAKVGDAKGLIVAPGLIDTGMLDMEKTALDAAMGMIPLKRMGRAEEVAGLASYLMSDIAGYVTRQVISINGGMV